MDLGYVGPKFTRCNGKQGLDFCRERLDRAMVNPGWSSLFNVVEVEVLGNCSSDHNPNRHGLKEEHFILKQGGPNIRNMEV